MGVSAPWTETSFGKPTPGVGAQGSWGATTTPLQLAREADARAGLYKGGGAEKGFRGCAENSMHTE